MISKKKQKWSVNKKAVNKIRLTEKRLTAVVNKNRVNKKRLTEKRLTAVLSNQKHFLIIGLAATQMWRFRIEIEKYTILSQLRGETSSFFKFSFCNLTDKVKC